MATTTVQGATPPADPDPAPALRRRATARANAAVGVVLLVGFAALVWHRRWVSDDGLIVLRTVRQIVAGDGPVFNAGERVEANTSTLWTWLLALPGLVPGLSLNWAAVVAGLVCSVAGLGLALDAARRLHGNARLLVPCGALAVVALPPFWDFGTSGLETGLVVGWLGLTWWLLVRRLVARRVDDRADQAAAGPAWPVAVVLGLAPLVRPDVAVFGLAAAVALAVLERRRGLLRLLGLAVAAAALPVAYEVFRAGYYGLLIPGTALAKEAGLPRWRQGGWYLEDLVGTYRLGYPLALAATALLVLAWRSRRPSTSTMPGTPSTPLVVAMVVAAPVVAGLVMAAYVVRVGGDFMHARMLLPALFSLLLPVAALPLSRWTALPALGMAAWAAVCLIALRPAYQTTLGPHLIANERMYYVRIVGRPNPIVPADFLDHPVAPQGVAQLDTAPDPTLAITGPGPQHTLRWWLLPVTSGPSTIVWLNIGVTGALAPLSTRVLDPVGLANPLAAHTDDLPDGRIGHDKYLPPDWYAAQFGATSPGYLDPRKVAAARAALACPATVDVLASYRDPLTLDRFWRNLVGAPARTAYRYAPDPRVAARC